MIMMKVHSLQRHIEARKKKHMVVEFSVLQKSVKNNFKINISKISSFVDIKSFELYLQITQTTCLVVCLPLYNDNAEVAQL
jgi:hypothetical protein